MTDRAWHTFGLGFTKPTRHPAPRHLACFHLMSNTPEMTPRAERGNHLRNRSQPKTAPNEARRMIPLRSHDDSLSGSSRIPRGNRGVTFFSLIGAFIGSQSRL